MSHFGRATALAFFLAAILGHLEIFAYLYKMDIEGPELLYALTIPCILITFLVGLVYTLLLVLEKGLRAKPEWDKLEQQFHFAVGLIALSALVDLAVYLFAPHAWRGAPSGILQAAILLLTATLFVSRASFRESFENLVRKTHSSHLWLHYRSFLLFLLPFSVAADLYMHFNWVQTTEAKNSSGTNILLIVLDTVAAKHLPMYSENVGTAPFLSSLAEESVVFERPISTSSWTLPSHSSIFTGKLPSDHNATLAHQKLDNEHITLAELYREKGYKTAGFIGNPRVKAKVGLAQGFDVYRDRVDLLPYRPKFYVTKGLAELLTNFIRIDNEKKAPEVNSELMTWLKNNQEGAFFVFLNFIDPHLPYNLGSEYYPDFGVTSEQVGKANSFAMLRIGNAAERMQSYTPSEELRSSLLAAYHSEIRYLDENLKVLFEFLKRDRRLDNTIVVFVSDHGEEFFEHGGVDHLMTLNEEMLHVPLMIYAPWLLEAEQISNRVSTRKLFDFLQAIASKSPKELQSEDLILKPLIEPDLDVFAERFAREGLEAVGMQALYQDRYKRILARPEHGRLTSGLFDLETDPSELNDLSAQEPELVTEMDRHISQKLKSPTALTIPQLLK